MNETDFSKTTPAMRLLGRDTSVLRSVLTDLPTTGTITHCHLEAAERAREVYAQARADLRLRRLFQAPLPSDTSDEVYSSGTLAAAWREQIGSRHTQDAGPSRKIGYNSENIMNISAKSIEWLRSSGYNKF